jgi:hypothetical protein
MFIYLNFFLKVYYIMNIQLKKFDMNMIDDDKIICCSGARGSGKSYLLRDLLYHKKDIPVGTVISPTEEANKFFSDFVPQTFIHDKYTPQLLESVIKRQKMVTKRYHTGESDIDRRAFLIMDDCLYDNKWKNDENIRQIFMNGRHYKILYILTMQYVLGIPPTLRTNIDFTFIFRENIVANRKRLYDNFAGMFPSFETFCQVMNQCTENYECLVIHNSSKSNKIIDQVYWYKAEKYPDFQVGSPHFWEFHENNFSNNDKDEEDDNLQTFRPTRKGPTLTVRKTNY